MKIAYIILFICLSMNQTLASSIKLLHYNIKELDSKKIKEQSNQIKSVSKVIKDMDFNLMSLNEIQYDQKNIPNKSFKTNGQNILKLNKLLELNFAHHSFAKANTGLNAKTKADGTYYISPNSTEAREHADEVNFGTMPGQYSTGALSKFKIISEKIYTDVVWREFNPKLDLTPYKTPSGKDFPNDMKLFDKSFTDLSLDIDGKTLHLILFHTVPSYHFGNSKSVNDFRNAEQLRFLEWYVSGNTNYEVGLKSIKPLSKGSYYMIVGDLNVDINDQESEGSVVLKAIIKKAKSWISPDKLTFTNESSHYAPKPMRLLLDYIIVSKNIKVLDAKILHPNFSRQELGCGQKPSVSLPDKIIVSYTKQAKTCFAMVDKNYVLFKQASDHYPLYGEFELK